VGFIDAQRYPFPPINTPPSQMESGFILARENNPATGNLVHRYKLAADEIFLLCRGAACTAANNSQ
jgi:hypothetical protein